MESRYGQRPSRMHSATDSVPEFATRVQRHDGRVWILPVTLLQRRLDRPQLLGLHRTLPVLCIGLQYRGSPSQDRGSSPIWPPTLHAVRAFACAWGRLSAPRASEILVAVSADASPAGALVSARPNGSRLLIVLSTFITGRGELCCFPEPACIATALGDRRAVLPWCPQTSPSGGSS
jgi:hypothetical protein